MAFGKYGSTFIASEFGSPHTGLQTASLNTTNDAWAARFFARGTNRDIIGFALNFSTVTGSFTCQLRIETISTTDGKPTGTLYDANASKSFTPVAGWQLVSFTTPPSTHLTAGTAYAVVIKVTAAGTTLTLNSYHSTSVQPMTVFSSADGGSTWTEPSTSAWPVGTLMLNGDEEVTWGLFPYVNTSASWGIYGKRAAGITFTNSVPFEIIGIRAASMYRSGTPSDLRVRIFDSSDVVVTGSTITIDKDYLTGLAGRHLVAYFNDPINLPIGTYRYIIDQTDHASTSGNYYCIRTNSPRNDATRPSSFKFTTTTDIEQTNPTWSTHDDDFEEGAIGVIFNDIITVTGSGGLLVHPGMSGGMRG